MVRLVKILGVLFIVGFFLWALLPGYNSLVGIMNTTFTGNLTSLESAEWKLLLPVIIPAVIIIAVIWHHFSRKSEGGEE